MREQITYVWCETARRYVAPQPVAAKPEVKPTPKKKKPAKKVAK